MARGDPPANPWTQTIHDSYTEFNADQADPAAAPHSSVIFISVAWDSGTRNLTGGTIHRDTDCRFTTIVFDVPVSKKPLGPVPVGDTAFTAQQIRTNTGFRTIDDLLAVQVNAE